jgi:hypothetical protein
MNTPRSVGSPPTQRRAVNAGSILISLAVLTLVVAAFLPRLYARPFSSVLLTLVLITLMPDKVVSRRSVRRRRLYLDRFFRDELRQYGFRLLNSACRRLENKTSPFVIDRKGRTDGQ